MMRQILSVLLICSLCAACDMGEVNKKVPSRDDLREDMTREPEWSKIPALRRIPVSSDLFLAKSVRPPMPGKAAEKEISLRFTKGNATISDLVGILDYQAIPVVIRPSGGTGQTSDDINATVLPFRSYDGTLGNLIKKLARSLDLAVWWENDALYISDRDRYVISVPQQQDVIDTIIGELEDFGAEDISPSLYGGRIIYSARPQVNEEVIIPYLNGLQGNLAEITLQVAVVQLQVTDAAQRGIDWSSFQLQFGDPARAATTDLIKGVSGGISGATGIADVKSATATKGTISTSQLGGIGSNALGVSAAIQYLSQFGRTSTRQMVELRTLAGQPVQLVSSQTTPYVKGVSGTTSTTTGSSNVTTSVDTSTVDTGLTMNFTPYYDSLMGLVVVDVNIQVSSLLEMTVLSTGSDTNANATQIKQPKTSKNQITDIVRIPAGEVVILGGVHEENKAQKRQAPFDAFDTLGSKSDDNTTTLNFFIMRPVVTIFDPKGADVNTTLPGDGIDSSDKAIKEDEAVMPDTSEDIAPPPENTNTDKRGKKSIKSVDELYGAGDDTLPGVLGKVTAPKNGGGKPSLESILKNGFAGVTGLETQGAP